MIAQIKTALAVLKHWKLAALAILAAGWLWTLAGLHSERADHERTKAQYAYERKVATAAALANERRNRELETELNHATHQHAQAQQQLAEARRARAADARAADARLRNEARSFASAASARCADTSAAGDEPTAAEALDLLAGLLDRVAGRTTALAEFADEAHARATACAADYDRAHEALSAQ